MVAVRKMHAPKRVKAPLHRVLRTSLPCERWAAAHWWVEEYHEALESCGVAESQHERGHRLEALVTVLVVVRLLVTKLTARRRPAGGEAAESFGPEALALLEAKLGAVRRWLDQPKRVNRHCATGRMFGAQRRRPAWLADDLARLAALDVVV